MHRVFTSLFINVLGFVSLILLCPLGSMAQEPETYSRISRADREAGAVFIRAGSDASFDRFATMSRTALDHRLNITLQDIVDANPGKIIYVCRLGDGTRRLSRNPSLHDRCASGDRRYWLVQGLTYLIPSALAQARGMGSEPLIESFRQEVSRLNDLVEGQERTIAHLRSASQEPATNPSETGVRVPTLHPVHARTPATSRAVQSYVWVYFLLGLMAGLGIAFFSFMFVRRRDQREWHRILDTQEETLMARHEEKNEERLSTIRERDKRIRELENALEQSALLLKERDEEIEHLSDKSGIRSLKKSAIGHAGADQQDEQFQTRAQEGVDAPSEYHALKSRLVMAEALNETLKIKLLSVEAEIERRRNIAERIPKLMNELEELKPSGLDRLYIRQRTLELMRSKARQEAKKKEADASAIDAYVIAVSYDHLFEEIRAEIEQFEHSEAGERAEEIREELNTIFMEVTGLYGYAATMEASLERDRREIDELHLKAKAELWAAEQMQERLREELQKQAAKSEPAPFDGEPTRKIKLPFKEAQEASQDVKLWEDAARDARIAELEGRFQGMQRQMLLLNDERNEQVKALEARIHTQDASRDEQAREFRAQIEELRMQLAEAQAHNAELQTQNEALIYSTWDEKKAISFPKPRATRRERAFANPKSDRPPSTEPPPAISRDVLVKFSDAIVRLMDDVGPHLERKEGCLLPLDRYAAIDFAHILAGAVIEDPLQSGMFIPLRVLPHYLADKCGGELPDRLRSQTMKPPPAH